MSQLSLFQGIQPGKKQKVSKVTEEKLQERHPKAWETGGRAKKVPGLKAVFGEQRLGGMGDSAVSYGPRWPLSSTVWPSIGAPY